MVSSTTATLFLDLNVKKVKEKIAAIKHEIDKLGFIWRGTRDTIKREARAILRTINTLINIAQNLVERMGMILTPFQEYITGLINITITTLLQMSIAASSTVIGAPLGVTIAASAGVFAVISHAMAVQGFSDAAESMGDLEDTVRDLGTLVTSFGEFV